MSQLITEAELSKSSLFDETLGVFALAYHLDRLRELALSGPLTVVYFHLPFVAAAEETGGWALADQYHREAHAALCALLTDRVGGAPQGDFVRASERDGGAPQGDFVRASERDGGACLIAPDGGSPDNLTAIFAGAEPEAGGPDGLALRLGEALQAELSRRLDGAATPLSAGSRTLRQRGDLRFDRQFRRVVADARADALAADAAGLQRETRDLHALIHRGAITTVYQPIFQIADRKIIGYEALSRGPGGEFHSPDALFAMAARTGLTPALDALCQRSAARTLPPLPDDVALFVNASPLSFVNGAFDAGRFTAQFTDAGLKPAQVVIELTERSSIEDFTAFGKTMRKLKKCGFRLAIDDVGSGFSSLQTISETEPEYIKIDRALVDGIDRFPIKREIVRNLARIGQSTRIAVIAEGVERDEELSELVKIPVDLAQGFLFAHPGAIPA